MSDYDTTAKIHGLLRLRYQKIRGEWATFAEFTPGTGVSATSGRRWDFLAISCWGSAKGHRIVFEVKASRGDWLKELSDPGKRSFAEKLCHETWIATIPGIVRDGELPEGWGLLEVAGTTLRTVRAAFQRETVDTPDAFVAALARRGAEEMEDHAPPPPRGAWKFAGKDIAEEDLVRTCREILDVDHERSVNADVERKTFELSRRANRLEWLEQRLLQEVNKELGVFPADVLLQRDLEKILNRKSVQPRSDVANELRRLASLLDAQ